MQMISCLKNENKQVLGERRLLDKLIWLLVVALISSFYINAMIAHGRYILLAISITIFILLIISNKGLSLYVDNYQKFTVVFCIYCLLSSFWSIQPSDAIKKSKTIFEIIICFYPLYIYFKKKPQIDPFLKAIMCAGYIVSLYTFYYYGFNNIINFITNSKRLNNDFNNVNIIGMLLSISVVITFYYLITQKFSLYMLLTIPELLIIAATESRKAFVLLVLGIIMVFLFIYQNKLKGKNLLKTILYIFITLLIVIYLEDLGIFSGVLDRMQGLFGLITGKGEIDLSAKRRGDLINLGLNIFINNPILGIGIGNPHIIVNRYFDKDYYLHNNYVELLAGGGIVGFLIYYSMHFYLLYSFLKRSKMNYYGDKIIIILILLQLIMDFGVVSYYDKITYIYLMLYFLQLEKIEKRQ